MTTAVTLPLFIILLAGVYYALWFLTIKQTLHHGVLDAASYITKSKEGRCVRYVVNPEMTLRHDNHSDVPILDFLSALGLRKK